MRAKKVARRSRKRRDIVKASRMAIQLAKRLRSSNNIAKKESAHHTMLDEMRYVGCQLRLSNLLSCASVSHYPRRRCGANSSRWTFRPGLLTRRRGRYRRRNPMSICMMKTPRTSPMLIVPATTRMTSPLLPRPPARRRAGAIMSSNPGSQA